MHGRRHCTDGPAVIGADGSQAWYIRGIPIPTKEEFERIIKNETGKH